VETLAISLDSDLSGLTTVGRQKFEEYLCRYASELIQEAAWLEVEGKEDLTAPAQIKPEHVDQAHKAVRRKWRVNQKPTNEEAAIAVLAAVASGTAGTLGGMLHSTLQAALFGASVAVAVGATWRAARRQP
jgi:hypothetical protein